MPTHCPGLVGALEDLLELDSYLKDHNCRLVLINEKLDTSTAAGKMFYLMVAGFAELESDTISERVKSDRKLKADNGIMHTGGARRYGYNRSELINDQYVIVPDPDATDGSIYKPEAAVVRDAAKRVLNNETLASICKRLNARKVATVEGGAWSGARLVGGCCVLLTSPVSVSTTTGAYLVTGSRS